ncbi:hypothetical protein FKM82_025506 [Ascaphus truei]
MPQHCGIMKANYCNKTITWITCYTHYTETCITNPKKPLSNSGPRGIMQYIFYSATQTFTSFFINNVSVFKRDFFVITAHIYQKPFNKWYPGTIGAF